MGYAYINYFNKFILLANSAQTNMFKYLICDAGCTINFYQGGIVPVPFVYSPKETIKFLTGPN